MRSKHNTKTKGTLSRTLILYSKNDLNVRFQGPEAFVGQMKNSETERVSTVSVGPTKVSPKNVNTNVLFKSSSGTRSTTS